MPPFGRVPALRVGAALALGWATLAASVEGPARSPTVLVDVQGGPGPDGAARDGRDPSVGPLVDHEVAAVARWQREEICIDCHEKKYRGPGRHYPASEGLCRLCHAATAEHVENGSAKAVSTQRAPGDTCMLCHDRGGEDGRVHFASLEEGTCSSCHDPHGSAHAGFFKAPGNRMCNSCHDGPPESPHARMDLPCTWCHAIHGKPGRDRGR